MSKYVAIAAVLAMASMAPAATIMIDMGDDANGTTSVAPASDGNYWNVVTAPNASLSDLVDSTGAQTTVDVATSGWNGGEMTSSDGADGTYVYPTVIARDGYSRTSANSQASVTLSSLSGTEYSVTIFGCYTSVGPGSWGWMNVTVGDETQTMDIGRNYFNTITFSGVTPESGEVEVVFTAGGAAYVNAMVIEEVPEPATMSLVGLGSLLMLRRRRRHG